ncbi:cellulose binding domain-containing protein, partial [Lentzea kentuckyensis]|uniref:cellulose binding domain-containing protein n=1 Tax=Lentzea kentuckyensis TaxID=360086 RepID=UPI001B80CD07
PTTTTTPPPAKTGCSATYRVAREWPNGFHTELIVRNLAQTPVTRWVVHWKFPSGQQIRETWGMTARQTGADVVTFSPDGNGTIAAGGQVSLRFNAVTAGPNVTPTSFTLNGVTCASG